MSADWWEFKNISFCMTYFPQAFKSIIKQKILLNPHIEKHGAWHCGDLERIWETCYSSRAYHIIKDRYTYTHIHICEEKEMIFNLTGYNKIKYFNLL